MRDRFRYDESVPAVDRVGLRLRAFHAIAADQRAQMLMRHMRGQQSDQRTPGQIRIGAGQEFRDLATVAGEVRHRLVLHGAILV